MTTFNFLTATLLAILFRGDLIIHVTHPYQDQFGNKIIDFLLTYNGYSAFIRKTLYNEVEFAWSATLHVDGRTYAIEMDCEGNSYVNGEYAGYVEDFSDPEKDVICDIEEWMYYNA